VPSHLRRTITEFVGHDHAERNHQGLGNALVDGASTRDRIGPIRQRPRLGGLLNYYDRAAWEDAPINERRG